jgi:hypothetical protein
MVGRANRTDVGLKQFAEPTSNVRFDLFVPRAPGPRAIDPQVTEDSVGPFV